MRRRLEGDSETANSIVQTPVSAASLSSLVRQMQFDYCAEQKITTLFPRLLPVMTGKQLFSASSC